ncbi:MAG: acyl-CoA thioesterase [Frankiales bacterium]|nr:acyl-CoA thioesterase [Frankiales bacterium]
MTTTAVGLVALLDLERIEVDVFRGRQPDDDRARVFGGQVAAQALVAAGRTTPEDRPVHSLHAYFLRPGDPRAPIVYLVDRIRDGRSFTTRRVVGVQHGKAIFNLQTSFAVHEEGLEHADPGASVPPPEDLPSMEEVLRPFGGPAHAWWATNSVLDARPVTDPAQVVRARGDGPAQRVNRLWMRTTEPLPDDPLVHVCAAAFASDATLLDAVLVQHRLSWDEDLATGASLDHAMWFHAPFRADEWFLYEQHSAWAGGGRGLARGVLTTRDGRRVASVVQEGLLRTKEGPA